MSLVFPLPLAQWQDLLVQSSVTFGLRRPEAIQELAGGDTIRARLGRTRWVGELALATVYHRDSFRVESLFGLLVDQGGTFLITDPRYKGPAAGLGSGTATVAFVSADRRRIRFSGYTGTYTPGDLFSIFHSGRYTLHRVVVGEANAEWIEVAPAIPHWVAAGQAVEFQRPVCKAQLMASGARWGRSNPLFTSGMSIGWQQVFS